MMPNVPPLPAGPFDLIAADPPWTFATRSPKGKGRSPERHYDCLSFAELVDLAPAMWGIAAPDSVLLLWATLPMLRAGLDLMAAWGFEYKTTAFVWVKVKESAPHPSIAPRMDGYRIVKPRVGLGYYTRANAELVLLGTRGNGLRRAARDVQQVIFADRAEHSRKPDEFFARAERLFGAGPNRLRCLEMFARGGPYSPSWQVWGNEAQPAIPALAPLTGRVVSGNANAPILHHNGDSVALPQE